MPVSPSVAEKQLLIITNPLKKNPVEQKLYYFKVWDIFVRRQCFEMVIRVIRIIFSNKNEWSNLQL